jgi:hypothetical protein
MFILRAESHTTELLRSYIKKEEMGKEEELKEDSSIQGSRHITSAQAHLGATNAHRRLDKQHWERWRKKYLHPVLEDKNFKHPAFKSHSKVHFDRAASVCDSPSLINTSLTAKV